MSGIAGLYHLDGRTAGPIDLMRMTDAMAHRGPDGVDHWREGSVSLGHLMLHTTPESLHETLPLTDRSGHFTITADARIDNRAELMGQLGVNGKPNKEIADSELILAAYKKWGKDCPNKLLGAFAFAIWDGRRKQLFCARDHFGVKPFYYFASERLFAFASGIKGLLTLSAIPTALNEERLGDFLATICYDKKYTFYDKILRLPPAHTLTSDRESIRIDSYWSLDPHRTVHFGSDEEYVAAFRERFREAVRCRMRSAKPVGSFLSGGLDSSAITCIARDLQDEKDALPLSTFSSVYEPSTGCDERSYIEAIRNQGGLRAQYHSGAVEHPLATLETLLKAQDQPFYAPNRAAAWERIEAVGNSDVRVLLDGHGGDEVVSHGRGYLKELAKARNWISLARELKGVSQGANVSFMSLMWGYTYKYGLNPFINNNWPLKITRRLLKAIGRRLPFSGGATSSDPQETILTSSFAQRIGLKQRQSETMRRDPRGASTARERHYRTLNGPLQPYAFEALDQTPSSFGIESRYPFWDKRLVEFCLALPTTQKLQHGWNRLILRRAMEEILPPKVQWRRDKTNFLPVIARDLRRDQDRLDDLFNNQLETIESFVDLDATHAMYRRFISDSSDSTPFDVFMTWKIAVLLLWLQEGIGPWTTSPISKGSRQGTHVRLDSFETVKTSPISSL